MGGGAHFQLTRKEGMDGAKSTRKKQPSKKKTSGTTICFETASEGGMKRKTLEVGNK